MSDDPKSDALQMLQTLLVKTRGLIGLYKLRLELADAEALRWQKEAELWQAEAKRLLGIKPSSQEDHDGPTT